MYPSGLMMTPEPLPVCGTRSGVSKKRKKSSPKKRSPPRPPGMPVTCTVRSVVIVTTEGSTSLAMWTNALLWLRRLSTPSAAVCAEAVDGRIDSDVVTGGSVPRVMVMCQSIGRRSRAQSPSPPTTSDSQTILRFMSDNPSSAQPSPGVLRSRSRRDHEARAGRLRVSSRSA